MKAQLDAVEAELRRLGYWTENPPDLLKQVEEGKIASYLDAPSFELWLQQIFLPRAREAIRTKSLPDGSAVGEMARRQYDYHSLVPEAHGLMWLLKGFDGLVEEYARCG